MTGDNDWEDWRREVEPEGRQVKVYLLRARFGGLRCGAYQSDGAEIVGEPLSIGNWRGISHELKTAIVTLSILDTKSV
jgi:hypothetical protein